jgi:arylsulfatase A-like enzyme
MSVARLVFLPLAVVFATTFVAEFARAQQADPSPGAKPPAGDPAPAGERPARSRSVLFYVVDTCRADHVSADGYARPTTPNLEKLAARGARFANCFSQAPWTKPAVGSILTSCYPSVTGMHRIFDQLDRNFVTLPEAMRGAGYAVVGFSANPLVGRLSNFTQGFQRFTEAVSVIPGGDPIHGAGGSAHALNRLVLPWLAANRAWPFFLFVQSIDPHEEYRPAPEFLKLFADPAYEPEYRREWQALLDVKPKLAGNHCTKEHFEAAKVAIEPFEEYGRNLYDASIRANDEEIGRVVEALRAGGRLDDTVIVVTADHGEEFMEHGGTSHGFTLWNELIHVPLVLVAPGLVPEGLVVKEPVQSIDIYPTLLELLHLPLPAGLQGKSLAPLLRGEPADGHPIYSENHESPGAEQIFLAMGNTLSVVRGPWKLILNLKSPVNRPRPRRELYRLDRDFAEREELSEREPAVADELEKLLLSHWASDCARHEGVESRSLSIEELKQSDPETLEQLRRLGYVR